VATAILLPQQESPNKAARNMKLFLMVLSLTVLCAGARAQTGIHPYLTDKVVIYAGAFFPRLNLELTVDGSIGGDDRNIDFEKQFGLPTSDEFFSAELNWRFGEKWSLRTQHFNAGRVGTSTLEKDIEWGDEIFLVGTTAKAVTDLELTRLFFARALDSKYNTDAGIGFGVHYIDLTASVTGTIEINGMPFGGEKRSVGTDVFLPNIGGWYSHSFSPKWAFTSRVDWLEASIGDIRGSILNMSAGVNYQVFEHFGIGLSYQDFTLRYRANEKFWRGRAKGSYRGAFVYLTGNW